MHIYLLFFFITQPYPVPGNPILIKKNFNKLCTSTHSLTRPQQPPKLPTVPVPPSLFFFKHGCFDWQKGIAFF